MMFANWLRDLEHKLDSGKTSASEKIEKMD